MPLLKPARIPAFIKWCYPNWYVWDKPSAKPTVYLTFDDGPVPEVTPWVLDVLKKYNCKATFFCIGENVKQHPTIFKAILDEGHQIGNHTFNHLKGTSVNTHTYIQNTLKAQQYLDELMPQSKTTLFRPPYGKIQRSQAKLLRERGYQIVMYRTIAYDWDAAISKEVCLENACKAKNGDLIVFHDSVKAYYNLEYVLPQALAFYKNKGFEFGLL